MQDLYELDMIPDPDVCDAVLRACRRVNDFALAIRFIESLKEKCICKRWTHKWLMDKVCVALCSFLCIFAYLRICKLALWAHYFICPSFCLFVLFTQNSWTRFEGAVS